MITERKFADLDISDAFKRNLAAHQHINLFSIQQKMETAFEQDEDFPSIFLESPCGSGKTLAVLIPLMHQVSHGAKKFVIFTAPSLELCRQHFEYSKWLFEGVEDVTLLCEDDVNPSLASMLFTSISLPATLVFFGTPHYILRQLLSAVFDEETYEIVQPLVLIIDEADNQLKSNELIELCEFLRIRPETAFEHMIGRQAVQLVFSSATLAEKLDLVNSIFVAPGKYLVDENQPANKLFRVSFDPNFLYRMVYSNLIPLPALVVFDDRESLKTVTEKFISRSINGFVWPALECVVKPFELQQRNIRVTSKLAKIRFTKRSLVLVDISQIRGLDYEFQTVIVAALESKDVEHALGRAGRGLHEGIRIQMVENTEQLQGLSTITEIEEQLQIHCKSTGQPRIKPKWDEIEQCEEQTLESLTVSPGE